MADKQIRVTLKRSTIGEKPKTRATVQSLGLRRINHSVEHPDTPSVRGMIRKVQHLVAIEEDRESRSQKPEASS